MSRRAFLVVPLLIATCASLSGCMTFLGGNDPQNYAMHFCEDQVKPEFPDPKSVVYDDNNPGGPNDDRTGYDFQIGVTADDANGVSTRYTLTCEIAGEPDHFTVMHHEITEEAE